MAAVKSWRLNIVIKKFLKRFCKIKILFLSKSLFVGFLNSINHLIYMIYHYQIPIPLAEYAQGGRGTILVPWNKHNILKSKIKSYLHKNLKQEQQFWKYYKYLLYTYMQNTYTRTTINECKPVLNLQL